MPSPRSDFLAWPEPRPPFSRPAEFCQQRLLKIAAAYSTIAWELLILSLSFNPAVALMPELVPISLLSAGQVAEVRQVVGPPEQVRRLEELGLRDGAVLEMVRSGSPCIVRVA